MDRGQGRDALIAAGGAGGLFLVIALLIKVLSGPLMHTSRTERFYQPDWLWLFFVLASSIGAIQTRNA